MMAVSPALQAALDRAESLKADAQSKIQAVVDAKDALAKANADDASAVKAADEAAASLDEARKAVIDAATAEFTIGASAAPQAAPAATAKA